MEYSRKVRLPVLLQPTSPISSAARSLRRVARHIEQPAVEVERLLGVQESIEVRLFGQIADPLVLAHVGRRAAEDRGFARGRKQQAEQQLDGGRLARAVGAEQTEDLAALDLKVEGVQGDLFLAAPEVAVDLGQVAGFDDHLAHGRAGRPGLLGDGGLGHSNRLQSLHARFVTCQ